MSTSYEYVADSEINKHKQNKDWEAHNRSFMRKADSLNKYYFALLLILSLYAKYLM